MFLSTLRVALVLFIYVRVCCHGRVISLRSPDECPGSETSTSSSLAGEDKGNSSLQICMSMDEALPMLESGDELHLAPGTHTIRKFSTNSLRSVSNVSIIGNVSHPESVIIDCFEGVGLFFFNVSDLTVAGITVEHCGINGTDRVRRIMGVTRELIDVLYTPLSDFSAAMYLAHCPNLQLSNLIIRDNRGFGLVGVNLIGNVTFHRVHVTQNYPFLCVMDLERYSETGGSGGGLFLFYQNYVNRMRRSDRNSSQSQEVVVNHDTRLHFTDSNITDNFACRLNLFNVLRDKLPRSIKTPVPLNFSMVGAGGVTFSLAQSKYHVNAHFEGCIFRNNSSTYSGAAMHISQFELSDDSHVFIERTIFEENGEELIRKYGERGLGPAGALLVWYYTPLNYSNKNVALRLLQQQPSSVVVSNSQFRRNVARSGGAVCALSFEAEISLIQDLLVFDNTEFMYNRADFGGAIYLSAMSHSAFAPGLRVRLHSIDVTQNFRRDSSAGNPSLSESGIVDVNFLNITISGDNYISHNQDTAISLRGAIATVSGSSLFEYNVGNTGGAASLTSESYLVLTGFTNITFHKNKAFIAGGAVYVNFDSTRFVDYDCFVFFDDSDFFCDLFARCGYVRISISFINNTAPLGSAIYGSTFASCPWAGGSFESTRVTGEEKSIISTISAFEPILTIRPKLVVNASQNIINTPAYSIYQRERNLDFTIMPGMVIETDLGAFDQLNQPVPLTVFSKLTLIRGEDSDVIKSKATIGATNRYLLNSASNFTTVPIQVFGSKESLYRVSITSNEAQVELSFLVRLTNCTLGYFYNHSSHSCICQVDEFFTDVTCVDDGSLIIPSGVWVGFIDDEYEYARGNCIFDYCSDTTQIFLDNDTSQCRNSRSGVLCGQCREGYSRIFGSTNCMQCSNNYIALIVVFAFLGILVVVLISLLNITITDGYINGLIFYSNILSLYLNVSIPVPALLLTRLLISFINLNLGIEMCFYDGMTDIQLTALNLVFPLYLGAILLVITLILKYFHSKHYAKLLSKVNITHVFATLLLLTYSSILRTCIDILSFVDIGIVGGGGLRKWRIDPNQDYFRGLHIFEFFAAIFLLVVLFPFPLFLLFPRVTLRLPYLRRMKPLIDAFIAPLADGSEFWVGFRILCRNFFFLLVLLEDEPRNVTLCVFIILITVLEAYIKPFKTTSRNFIDLLIMANLTIVSLLGMVIQIDLLSMANVTKFASVLVTLFSITACAIFMYYLVTAFPCADKMHKQKLKNFLRSKFKIGFLVSYFGKGDGTSETMQKTRTEMSRANGMTHTSVAFPSLRREVKDTVFVGYRESMFNGSVDSAN